MNYLAHIFLSGDDPQVLIGNILEDFTKGRVEHPRNNKYGNRIKKGLKLHRLIDTFIDTNDLVKEAKAFFYPSFSKYSSAVMDIIFDYFLIKNWSRYSGENFVAFRFEVYEKFEKNWHLVPDAMRPLVGSMIKHDWLKEYENYDSLTYVMGRFSAKAKSGYDFRKAVKIMKQNEEKIDKIFNSFFPLIIIEVDKFLENN